VFQEWLRAAAAKIAFLALWAARLKPCRPKSMEFWKARLKSCRSSTYFQKDPA